MAGLARGLVYTLATHTLLKLELSRPKVQLTNAPNIVAKNLTALQLTTTNMGYLNKHVIEI